LIACFYFADKSIGEEQQRGQISAEAIWVCRQYFCLWKHCAAKAWSCATDYSLQWTGTWM